MLVGQNAKLCLLIILQFPALKHYKAKEGWKNVLFAFIIFIGGIRV
jgi:hypothetical protein